MQKITLTISGMACNGCAANISNALHALDGVIAAEVSYSEGSAEIEFDPSKVSAEQLKSTVIAAGYQTL